MPLLGIGFHSLLDGMVYSVAFRASDLTGLVTATGMVLHEFPEGIVTYALLRCAGYSASRAVFLSILAAAITTPAGAVLSWPLIERVSASELGLLLATAAGALLYVGASHLLSQTQREPRRFSFAALAAGFLVAIGLSLAPS